MGSVKRTSSARVRISRSRSSKVINCGTNRKRIYDFLLVSHSNCGHILHRFRDIAVFPPHLYSVCNVAVVFSGLRWNNNDQQGRCERFLHLSDAGWDVWASTWLYPHAWWLQSMDWLHSIHSPSYLPRLPRVIHSPFYPLSCFHTTHLLSYILSTAASYCNHFASFACRTAPSKRWRIGRCR